MKRIDGKIRKSKAEIRKKSGSASALWTGGFRPSGFGNFGNIQHPTSNIQHPRKWRGGVDSGLTDGFEFTIPLTPAVSLGERVKLLHRFGRSSVQRLYPAREWALDVGYWMMDVSEDFTPC
jgi:hypothetical protein